MINVYKYTRNWKSFHIHASSSEICYYVPEYKATLVLRNGGSFGRTLLVLDETDTLIQEGEQIVKDCDNRNGINGTLGETWITNVQKIEYEEEEEIKNLISNLKKIEELEKQSQLVLNALNHTTPKSVALLHLKYDVLYRCRCTDVEDCCQRRRGLEEEFIILPSNWDKTILEFDFDYEVNGGTFCKSSIRDFNSFPKLKNKFKEIIEDVNLTEEQLSEIKGETAGILGPFKVKKYEYLNDFICYNFRKLNGLVFTKQ